MDEIRQLSNIELLLGIVAGLVPVFVAWIKRPRQKILERGDNPHGHGFSTSGDYRRTDGTSAKRLKIYNGRIGPAPFSRTVSSWG